MGFAFPCLWTSSLALQKLIIKTLPLFLDDVIQFEGDFMCLSTPLPPPPSPATVLPSSLGISDESLVTQLTISCHPQGSGINTDWPSVSAPQSMPPLPSPISDYLFLWILWPPAKLLLISMRIFCYQCPCHPQESSRTGYFSAAHSLSPANHLQPVYMERLPNCYTIISVMLHDGKMNNMYRQREESFIDHGKRVA